MPLYDYQCTAGHRYEKREPFGSPAEQPCERCKKPARRVLNVPPIVFKGSGWYKTDSKRSLRAGATANGSAGDGEEAAAPAEGAPSAEPASPPAASAASAKPAPAKASPAASD